MMEKMGKKFYKLHGKFFYSLQNFKNIREFEKVAVSQHLIHFLIHIKRKW